jgi:hypothetical protein
MEVICLESQAFYHLVKEVVNRIKAEQNITEDPWITGEEVQKILGIKSKTTLQKYRDEGKIKFSQPSKKLILYERVSVMKFLQNHSHDTL